MSTAYAQPTPAKVTDPDDRARIIAYMRWRISIDDGKISDSYAHGILSHADNVRSDCLYRHIPLPTWFILKYQGFFAANWREKREHEDDMDLCFCE